MKQVPSTQPARGNRTWWVWISLILIGIVVYSVMHEDFSENEVKYLDPQGEISEDAVKRTDSQGEIHTFNEVTNALTCEWRRRDYTQ